MNNTTAIASNWAYVLNMLPEDLDESAAAKLALRRRREICCAEDLLRLCLAYGLCDMSLRQVAAWADAIGIGHLGGSSLLNRLRGSADWLGHLILRWMQDRGLPAIASAPRVRIVDATTLSKPGSTGTDWRLHMSMDLEQVRIASVEVTGAEGGETLLRHSFSPGEIVLGDRGYAHRAGAAFVLQQGGHVALRINWQNFPLISAAGEPLDIVACMDVLSAGEIGDWQVAFAHRKEHYPMRLVAIPKSDEAAEKERKRIRHEAQRKNKTPDPRSLKAAGFISVITDLTADALPCHEALELYRLRWQIEVYFKRLKSILHIDKLRAQNEQTTRTYIYANILGALIIDELRHTALTFFPWGYPLQQQTRQRVETLAMA